MAKTVEIQCVVRDSRKKNPTERISYVGGFTAGGWIITQHDAIEKIERGAWEFCITRNGRQIPVVVGFNRAGAKYLRLVDDGDAPDSLLSLPECS